LATFASYGDVTTYAGKLLAGDGRNRLKAYLDFPQDIDSVGNGAFVIADTENNVIRKIKKKGKVDTFAGTGSYGDKDGAREKSKFAEPHGVSIANNGVVFVADTGNDKIKRVKKGRVKTIAKNLNKPEGVDEHGNNVYFLDTGNNALKRVSKKGGTVTTITSSLNNPKKLKINDAGTYAYITDSGGYKLVRVKLDGGYIQDIAGDGVAGNRGGSCLGHARFRNLWGIALNEDAEGNTDVYVTDGTGTFASGTAGVGVGYLWHVDTNSKENEEGCQVNLLASDENMLSLNFPNGLTIYNDNAYVSSTGIGIIYRYNILDVEDNGVFAGANRFGDKNGKNPILGRPKDLALSKNEKWIYFSENNKVRKIRIRSKYAKLVAGNVVDNYNKNDNRAYIGGNARFSDAVDIEMSPNGKKLYVIDHYNNRIRYITVKNRKAYYLTGAGGINSAADANNGYQEGSRCPNEFDKGKSGCAYFSRPAGAVLSPNGKFLYVADTGNNLIRRVTTRGKNKGKTKLIAGQTTAGLVNGTGSSAKFNAPMGMAINNDGTVLYVADRNNHAIRKIDVKTKKVITLVGTGKAGYEEGLLDDAVLSYPQKLNLSGNILYFSEVGSQKVRLVDLSKNVTKLVAGGGDRGFQNGVQKAAQFNNPNGIVTKGDSLYVADSLNDLIRKVNIEGEAPYTNAAPSVSYVTPKSLKYSDYPSGNAMIEIKGSNFRYGAQAYFGSYKVATYVQNSGSLAVEVPITSMAVGYYEVKVENSDGQYDKLLRGFSAQEINGNVPNIDHWTD
ncbi:IPT/TIG domain-containing protein, partial [Patescibacteria group bacterium]|nr:IPT/TIG domain-containing protein [Patescibacteria group bacterium]